MEEKIMIEMENESGKTSDLIKKIENFDHKICNYLKEKYNITPVSGGFVNVDGHFYTIKKTYHLNDEVWSFIKEVLKDHKICFKTVRK